jgi:peroxiredoxin Q/BCP
MMRAMKALALLPFALAAACAAQQPASTTTPATASGSAATADNTGTATAAGTASAPASSNASATPAPSGSAGSATSAVDPLVGKPAPDFTAKAQNGTTVHLSSLKGKTVVVYFYPKDETPGCTKEACSFRDAWTALGKTGAVLVGVSADTLDSHKAFAAHYKLPFLLVSDPDGSIAKQFDVPFEGYHKRQTIVIGADGNIRKVYRQVDVGAHAQQILDDVNHPS